MNSDDGWSVTDAGRTENERRLAGEGLGPALQLQRPLRLQGAHPPQYRKVRQRPQHRASIRPTSCAAQVFNDSRRRLSREFAKQGDTGRGATASDCPTGRWRLSCTPRATSQGQDRSLTATSDPATGAWIAGPYRIPKLTMRVRFPSPAPHAKSVAPQANRAKLS